MYGFRRELWQPPIESVLWGKSQVYDYYNRQDLKLVQMEGLSRERKCCPILIF